MYEQYTDEQIVEMLLPKMNKCSNHTKWDGLIEKPWGNADLFKVIATIYRSAYIRGQLGRSFIIGEKVESKEKWVPANEENVKKGDKVRMIDKKAHKQLSYCFPKAGTIGTIEKVDRDNVFIQWPRHSTSNNGRWWANYEKLEVLVCE